MTDHKIVVSVQSSIDGRVAAADDVLDWLQVRDELHAHFVEVHRAAGAFVYGRTTYDGMAAYWPTAGAEADPFLVAYSKVWTAMPKVVVSRTLESAGWDTTVVRDLDALTAYQKRADGDLYVIGSPRLISALAERDLIDVFEIYVHPVVLGAGRSLVENAAARRGFTLVSARTFDGNVVKLRYERTVTV